MPYCIAAFGAAAELTMLHLNRLPQVSCWPLLLLTPHSNVAQHATAAPDVLFAPVATHTS